MKKPDASILITFKGTKSGDILATSRVVTADAVNWYRVSLPPGTDLAAMHRAIIIAALRHMEKHGGPATRMLVAAQPMLPTGEE